MQVARWGNSLAIRLPAHLVREMKLKEGDQLYMLRDQDGSIRLLNRAGIEGVMDSISVQAPPGWKFNRQELYDEELERRFPTIDDAAA